MAKAKSEVIADETVRIDEEAVQYPTAAFYAAANAAYLEFEKAVNGGDLTGKVCRVTVTIEDAPKEQAPAEEPPPAEEPSEES